MKVIRGMQSERIRREDPIQDYVERQEKEEKVKQDATAAASEADHKATLLRVRTACSTFRATCPDAWESFKSDIVGLHGFAYSLSLVTPMDMMRKQNEQGVSMDSNFWALQKAYCQGQLDILESFFRTAAIDLSKIPPPLPVVVQPENENTFKKVLTFFRNMLHRTQ